MNPIYKPTTAEIKEQAPKIFKSEAASASVPGWTEAQTQKIIDEITLDVENYLSALGYILPTTENGGAFYNIKRYISLRVIDHMGSAAFVNNLDDKYLGALKKRLDDLEDAIKKSTPKFMAGKPKARSFPWPETDILRK